MPFDGGHSKPKFRTLPHDWLDRELLRRHEHNYASGASALVQQEIAGVSQSLYHKPGGSWDWSWNYATEAYIRGRKHAGSGYQWDADTPAPSASGYEDDDWSVNLRRGASSLRLSSFDEDYPSNLPDVLRNR